MDQSSTKSGVAVLLKLAEKSHDLRVGAPPTGGQHRRSITLLSKRRVSRPTLFIVRRRRYHHPKRRTHQHACLGRRNPHHRSCEPRRSGKNRAPGHGRWGDNNERRLLADATECRRRRGQLPEESDVSGSPRQRRRAGANTHKATQMLSKPGPTPSSGADTGSGRTDCHGHRALQPTLCSYSGCDEPMAAGGIFTHL